MPTTQAHWMRFIPARSGWGLMKSMRKAPGEVGGKEDTEARPFRQSHWTGKNECEGEQEEDFVQLDRVAADAIAEIDGPGEAGRFAVGVVGESCEEAAYAAHGKADGQGQGKEIPGPAADAGESLDEFDADPAAEKAADDGLAAGRDEEIVESDRRGSPRGRWATAQRCLVCGCRGELRRPLRRGLSSAGVRRECHPVVRARGERPHNQ